MRIDERKFRREIQRAGLGILSRHKGGFQFTNTFFPYTSGEIGPYYVQAGVVQNNATDYSNATQSMTEIVRPYVKPGVIDIIAGGESRDWIFSFVVARELGLPHIMLYKDGKTVGADIARKSVALVSDLNNEGSSPKNLWVPTIQRLGGQCNHAFFYVDRMERGVQVLDDMNIQHHAAVPLDANAWIHLLNLNIISQEIYRNLRERARDQDSWAIQMLTSDKGEARLAEILADETLRAKGIKVLRNYTNKAEQVVGRLCTRNGAVTVREDWLKGTEWGFK